jgi:hypothetical protein
MVDLSIADAIERKGTHLKVHPELQILPLLSPKYPV